MTRTFGQFKQRVREKHDALPEDRPLLRAYHQGEQAGRAEDSRAACPYAPASDEACWQAWMLGYAEQYEAFVVARDA